MIRKLLFPALLVGLLGGCVSAGYGYRDGYYYGQPSVEYRYYDYGYPYSYGYYPYAGRYGYYNYYGYPYRYGYGYPYRYGSGYPYYPYYPHYRHRHPKPPVNGTPGPRPPHTDDGNDGPPPWRDPDRRRRMGDVAGRALQNQGTIQPPPREAPRREVRSEGPRTGPAMKRTQETRRRQSGDVQEP